MRKGRLHRFKSHVLQAFAWAFHVSFQCGGAWHEVFANRLGIEVLRAARKPALMALRRDAMGGYTDSGA
jgi:hypothetical protein